MSAVTFWITWLVFTSRARSAAERVGRVEVGAEPRSRRAPRARRS